MNNGGLECELREYVIFEGTKRDFRAAGGRIKDERPEREERPRRDARPGRPGADERPRRDRDRDTKGRRDERHDRGTAPRKARRTLRQQTRRTFPEADPAKDPKGRHATTTAATILPKKHLANASRCRCADSDAHRRFRPTRR